MSTTAPIVTDGEVNTLARRQHDLFSRFTKNVYTNPQHVLDGLQQLIEGKPLEIVPTVALESKASSETLIRVDRSVRPSYPDWVKMVMHPELEDKGPAEFDAAKLEQWLHPKQKSSYMVGNDLYEHLKSNNMLESCLGLSDLEEIRKKGIKFFRKHFKDKAAFGWRSVVRDSDGRLGVPFLIEDDGKVVIRWRWLDHDWDSNFPALRFAS